jgi:hypothetical protein
MASPSKKNHPQNVILNKKPLKGSYSPPLADAMVASSSIAPSMGRADVAQ